MDWIDLSQDRDSWPSFMYSVKNLGVQKVQGIS